MPGRTKLSQAPLASPGTAEPALALRSLLADYTHQQRLRPVPAWFPTAASLLITAFVVLSLLVFFALPGERWVGVLLLMLFLFASMVGPALVARTTRARLETEHALLRIVKDQPEALTSTDLIVALSSLSPASSATLRALFQARLTEKLPFADASEFQALPAAGRAWLRTAVLDFQYPETLRVAIALGLSALGTQEERAVLSALSTTGETERLREAARDGLKDAR